MQKLIVITDDNGTTHELYGLLTAQRDKRLRDKLDQDYIETLLEQTKSENSNKAKEAKDALIFLNAYMLAELDANFKQLEKINIEVSPEVMKDVHDAHNAAQRCFQNNNSFFQDELSDEFVNPDEAMTIGEISDRVSKVKKEWKKSGKSVKELYKEWDNKLKPKTKPEPLPVKQYSPAELEEFKKKYNKK